MVTPRPIALHPGLLLYQKRANRSCWYLIIAVVDYPQHRVALVARSHGRIAWVIDNAFYDDVFTVVE